MKNLFKIIALLSGLLMAFLACGVITYLYASSVVGIVFYCLGALTFLTLIIVCVVGYIKVYKTKSNNEKKEISSQDNKN